ncbi:MAG: ABC transporter substrate-binding protein [Ilumatobacter sp.]|uniref:ABC transporter substrate-binding protein n=1 Tax=Ilumatobacter sp. TaxID=1967498 RepID=UPI0032988F41
MKRRFVPIVLALSVGVVAACGGGSSSEPADTDSGPASSAPVGSSSDSPAEAAGENDPTKVLRVSYTVGPSRFDPHRASSSFDNTSLFLTYDRLVHQSSGAEAVPGLAESWEFSEDGGALDMKLREGVTFHDGEPFNAEAVKANIERGQTVENSAVSSELAVIEEVEVVDEFNVRFVLNGDAASLPLVLSDRAGMQLSPAAFDNADLDVQPVGAGMFTVAEYDQDARIVYEAYDDYWDPDAVQVAGIDFLIQTDSVTRLNALRSGQIDWTFVDPPQVSEAESAGLELLTVPSLAYYHLQLNGSFEPFADPVVRQALNHAINRDAIVDGLLLGIGGIAGVQPFPEGYFAHDDSISADLYEYDPEMARQMLADAGYPDGFTFEMIVPTVPNITQLGEAVQAQLAEIGVTAEIRAVQPSQTADIFYVQKEGQGLVSPWGGRPDPSQTLGLLYTAAGFSNPGALTTDAVEETSAAALEVQSPEDRALDLQAASRQVTEDALDVVIYFTTTPVVYASNVTGVEGWFSGKPEFRGMGVTS